MRTFDDDDCLIVFGEDIDLPGLKSPSGDFMQDYRVGA